MDLQKLTADAQEKINAADNLDALDQVRVDYLGKKGELTSLLKTLGKLPADERKTAGQDINNAKREVQQVLEQRKQTLEAEKLTTDLLLSDYKNKSEAMKKELVSSGYFDQSFLCF